MARFSFTQSNAGILITLLSIPPLVAGKDSTGYRASSEDLEKWFQETNAAIKCFGPGRITPINPLDTRVVWCSEQQGDKVCGGECTVYTGRGYLCVRTTHASCLAATKPVRMCFGNICETQCNDYVYCGPKLSNGFCYTPDTHSIQFFGASPCLLCD
ncbi:hypothetical protein BKA70DRAFT_1118979 [Coprinopsis sp. MPI-PUGE-AT-0042]|nr:hypothetical protein BKA70DRAFT_1118979 [Coprinopsis sp. MPI-PUGE-AT-0042]